MVPTPLGPQQYQTPQQQQPPPPRPAQQHQPQVTSTVPAAIAANMSASAATTAATATSAAAPTPSDKHRARRQRRGAGPHQYERFGCRRWRRRRFVCGPVGASASHVSNPAATASSRRRNATAGGFHAEHGARHQRRCGGSHQHDRFGIVRVPVGATATAGPPRRTTTATRAVHARYATCSHHGRFSAIPPPAAAAGNGWPRVRYPRRHGAASRYS